MDKKKKKKLGEPLESWGSIRLTTLQVGTFWALTVHEIEPSESAGTQLITHTCLHTHTSLLTHWHSSCCLFIVLRVTSIKMCPCNVQVSRECQVSLDFNDVHYRHLCS